MAVWDIFRRAKPHGFTVAGAVAGFVPKRPAARGWLAATSSRLTADLPGGAAAAPNREIRQQLAVLRARSRWLAQNDGHTAGFLRMLRRNVVGPTGIALQMRIRDDRDPNRQDENANQRIETAWREWSRVGVCDMTRRLSLTDILGLAVIGIARDGEALFRRVRDARVNRFGYALAMLDPSQLREDLNGRPADIPAGNVVRAGVEIDSWGAPVAYWIRSEVPNDDPAASRPVGFRTDRVPASEIFHLFLPEWPGQVRGVPWISPALRSLAMLDGYREAELTAARVAAAKMGFYTIGSDEEVPAELEADGALVQEATPGGFELLPKGVDFKNFDPQHPNQAFADFVAAALRPAASAVGLSYNAFANDAQGLNYSALRATELEDRDEFKTLQAWMISSFCVPMFRDWLEAALLNDALGLPASKLWKFNAPEFIGRGWQWVDPRNEVASNAEAVALGIKSRTQIVAEQGGDIADVAADLRREAELLRGLIDPGRMPSAASLANQEDTTQ